jgi:CubicO group peptidase (beta-lactamase class C family)
MRKIRQSILWVLLLFGTASAGADTAIEQIADYMRRLSKLGFSGALLIARGDEVLLHEGYGLAEREHGVAWSAQTVSTIGSITKQFTAAAILRLQERGLLNVSDSITRHFRDVPKDKSAITLHQLLTHSSGIVDLPDLRDFDPIEREDYVRRSLAQELNFAPGTSYAYSNANYSLLGAIVEQISGKNYEQFLCDEFFQPLQMRDTGYLLPRWDETRLAQGYRNGEKWGTVIERPMATDGPYWALRANGGIHSTLLDMWTWGKALADGKVLSAESMQQYWAPHVDEGGGSHYGYGWVVLDLGGERVITHNGGNGIHFADIAIVPSQKLFVGLQCNVIADFRLANRLLEQLGALLVGKQPLPRVPDLAPADPAALQRLAGTYEFADGGKLKVRVAAAELVIAAEDRAGFSQLFSQRPIDAERAERLCARIETILRAYLAGDVGPLHTAYEGRVSRELLEERTREQLAQWSEEFGAVQGLSVLGTAFRADRDETLARIEFERGAVLRTYVWDAQAEEALQGVSMRGSDTELRVLPDQGGDFMSFDAATGTSRPLRFLSAEPGVTGLRFDDSELSARRSG